MEELKLPRWFGVENPPAIAGHAGEGSVIPGWGRSPGGGSGNPLQYSCLENLMDGGPGVLLSMRLQRVRQGLSTEQQ